MHIFYVLDLDVDVYDYFTNAFKIRMIIPNEHPVSGSQIIKTLNSV